MSESKIIVEEPMDLYQVKDELARIKKRDGELNYRAAKTDEYVKLFTPNKKAKELAEKLLTLDITRLKEQQVRKIVDLMPVNIKDLKAILQGYTLTLSKDNQSKIIEIVKEYKDQK